MLASRPDELVARDGVETAEDVAAPPADAASIAESRRAAQVAVAVLDRPGATGLGARLGGHRHS